MVYIQHSPHKGAQSGSQPFTKTALLKHFKIVKSLHAKKNSPSHSPLTSLEHGSQLWVKYKSTRKDGEKKTGGGLRGREEGPSVVCLKIILASTINLAEECRLTGPVEL